MGKQDWRFVSGNAQLMLRKAHIADTDITSLAFSKDNLTLLSRAADDTLKVALANSAVRATIQIGLLGHSLLTISSFILFRALRSSAV